MQCQTEAEELPRPARAIGRKLDDITVYDDHNHLSLAVTPRQSFTATWRPGAITTLIAVMARGTHLKARCGT